MPKNLFQDMVKMKTQKKEILKKEVFISPNTKEIKQQNDFRQPIQIIKHNENGEKPKSRLWLIAIISIIFFLFALSFLFAKAQVIVTPKTKDFTLNEKLSAIKDLNTDGLSFDLVIISGEESKKVLAVEKKEVSLSAKGIVFLYNTFSSTPQKIAINTKLEGSNGKIYKTTTSVDVPGMNIEDGTAGRAEVNVYAVEAGEEYNSDPLDFKIVSFKGTSKYSKFYGRSNGSITGGFKGNSPTISDVEKEKTFTELKTTLKDKLIKKATDQIPSGFILFKDAVFMNIDEENVEFTSIDNNLPVTIKGTLYGFLFSEKELTQKIAKDTIVNYNDEEVYVSNIRDLTFSLSDKEILFSDVQNINFNLLGNAKIVWKFDGTKFIESLLSKSKKDFNQILSQYPNVDSAQLTLSPFWIRSFPSKLKDIKVIVNYPN